MAYSESQKRASMKYNKENYERIYMYVSPKDKEKWKQKANSQGISLSEFIKNCVNKEIDKD